MINEKKNQQVYSPGVKIGTIFCGIGMMMGRELSGKQRGAIAGARHNKYR